jgi:signal transduction histidine kinase
VSRAARSWLVLLLCGAIACAGLLWLTAQALRLEAGEAAGRVASVREAAARTALWRMDSAFTTEVLRETARLAANGGAPSPLFLGAFQLDPAGRCDVLAVAPGRQASFAAALAALPLPELCRVREHAAAIDAANAAIDGQQQANGQAEANDNLGEYQRRTSQLAQFAQNAGDVLTRATAAPLLVPAWLAAAGGSKLVFVQGRPSRRGNPCGLLADWDAVRAFLLANVRDLLPNAKLLPADGPPGPDEWRLASVPATLTAPAPAPDVATGAWTPMRLSLAAAWVSVLIALGAVALVVRAALRLGERRARFAAALTHELRTPLTSFRLYAELLANNLVRDDATRAEYHATLVDQAERLTRVVDGVLMHAGLEGSRAPAARPPARVADLLGAAVPALERRAAAARMRLVVDNPDGAFPATAAVAADPQAVEQILLNLVDNACKYAAGAADRRVHLRARADGRVLAIEVADHGPGIPAADAAAVFEPFRRGSEPNVVATAGVGLGLPLAREMARRMGGDLRLRPTERLGERPMEQRGDGACFLFTLPLLG